MREPLLRIGIHPLDVGFWNRISPSGGQGFLEDRILLGIDLDFTLTGAIDEVAGLEDSVKALCADFRTSHHGGDFLLFHHLPVDKFFDVGVIQIEADHFGSPSGRPARLNGACRSIADAKEGHQSGRAAAAGQRFGIAAKLGKVGSGPRPVFEQPRLSHPEIHDPTLVD